MAFFRTLLTPTNNLLASLRVEFCLDPKLGARTKGKPFP